MNPESLSRRSLDIHNARRLQAIGRVTRTVAARGGLDGDILWRQASAIIDPRDPFEFDLGFTFRQQGEFRLEIGYNPHLNLTRDVHRRLGLLFDALHISSRGVAPLVEAVPFYLCGLTAGLEWSPGGPAKATVLMEDLHTHMEESERKQTLATLCNRLPAARDDIMARFDNPQLCLIAADVAPGGVAGLRLFGFFERSGAQQAIGDACGGIPDAIENLTEFYDALPSRQQDELLLYYRKYDMQGTPVAAKLYYTPPQPADARDLADELVTAFGDRSHPNGTALSLAAELCDAEEISFDPVCLSMAVDLRQPAHRYLALYYALGGIPYEYMD